MQLAPSRRCVVGAARPSKPNRLEAVHLMRSVIRRTQTHSRASRGHGERIDMFHRDGEGLELNGRQVRRAGNQVQSSAIKCNQVQSSAITEMARALSPTGGRCGHAETKVRNFALPASSILMSSDTSNAYLMRKESRGAMANQRPSAAIGGHQWPSGAIRGHQRHSGEARTWETLSCTEPPAGARHAARPPTRERSCWSHRASSGARAV